jgi:hypothetical protein
MPIIKGNDQNNSLIGQDAPPFDTINEMYGFGGNDRLEGGFLASNYIWGGSGDDNLTGGGLLDRIYGEDGNDYLESYADGQLYGGSGNDTLIGRWDGTIYIDGGSGADSMTGDAGSNIYVVDTLADNITDTFVPQFDNVPNPFDTAIFTAPRLAYALALGSNVPDTISSNDGSISLETMERLAFTDGEFRVETSDIAAQAYRLYDATLDRPPDQSGLKFWLGALESGSTTLQQAADGFTCSPEFQNKYGSLDNGGFVDLIYDNVLERDPDLGGFQSWLNAMANGVSRSEVVLGFSESPENIELTRPAVEQGIWVRDDQAAMVARLYDTTLDRLPDASVLSGWTAAIKGGMSLQQAVSGFTGSPEFQQKYGTLDDTAFIQQLYRNVLDQEGEAIGVAFWKNALQAGVSRSDVVLGFSESAEHQFKLAPFIDDGIWLL